MVAHTVGIVGRSSRPLVLGSAVLDSVGVVGDDVSVGADLARLDNTLTYIKIRRPLNQTNAELMSKCQT